MTEFDIRELLSDYVENSIEIRAKEIVSADKIKEDVMNRIEKPALRKVRKWTSAALAAVICVAALGAAALAVSLLNLDERRGDVIDPDQPRAMDGMRMALEATDPSSGDVFIVSSAEPTSGAVYTTVNVVGTTGSPEYLAAQEWNDWLRETGDQFGNRTEAEIAGILATLPNDVYGQMGAYTDEAREALDSIVEKYGLRLPESWQNITMKDLYDMTGTPDVLPLEGHSYTGVWYEGGSLAVTNHDGAALENGKRVSYDLYRSVYGMFTRSSGPVTDQSIAEEWQYTTADGTTVTLDLGANRSVLMAELPDSFVYVHIRGGTENSDETRDFTGPDTLTRADLEAFAERIDFKTLDSIR